MDIDIEVELHGSTHNMNIDIEEELQEAHNMDIDIEVELHWKFTT